MTPSDALGARAASGPATAPPRSRQPPRLPHTGRRDARTDSTRSSMCVNRVAKCPPARVAIQPPSVESSNDCGKKRIVIPCSPSCCLERAGRRRRAWMRAARETSSTSSTRSSAPRSRRHAPRAPSTRASTPPTTLVPPPYGMTAAPAPAAHSSTRLDVRLVARRARRSIGRVVVAAAERADRVEVRLAVGVRARRDLVRRNRCEPSSSPAIATRGAGRVNDAAGSSSSCAAKPSVAGRCSARGRRLRGADHRVLIPPAPAMARPHQRARD